MSPKASEGAPAPISAQEIELRLRAERDAPLVFGQRERRGARILQRAEERRVPLGIERVQSLPLRLDALLAQRAHRLVHDLLLGRRHDAARASLTAGASMVALVPISSSRRST